MTIEDIKRNAEEAGYQFFTPGIMRLFNRRILPTIYYGVYFITSEQFGQEPRRYTIRRALPNGSIRTIGEFQQYETLGQAKRVVTNLSRLVELHVHQRNRKGARQ